MGQIPTRKEKRLAEAFYGKLLKKGASADEIENVITYLKVVSDEHKKMVTNSMN